MDTLSDKAKIVLAAFNKLGAVDINNKVTSYLIEDCISSDEDLYSGDIAKEINEQNFMDDIAELNLKSINTLIASLVRKDIIIKTDARSMKVNGQRRNLREYYLK